MNAYLIAALVVAALVAGAGVQGYRLGGDSVRAEYAEAAENARKDAEEKENHNRFLARAEAKNLQTALGKQRNLNRDIGTALEAHIRALPAPPAGCPAPTLSDGLLDAWNAANHASDRAPGRSVPGGSGTAASPDRSKPAGDGQEPR